MQLLMQRAGRRTPAVPHCAACLQHPQNTGPFLAPPAPSPHLPPAHVMRLADVTHAFWPSASSCSGMGHWLSGASASISM